ncbi:diguanylate cyclase [Campylobacter sp. VicNov18]|uniref:bile resistance response regulator CbrR n=1 Tax=Campylobacter bilis TaxID=2691918 RepID=UPI00130E5139|nr:diguanylate cyclase [Campylobacter bilis]MPV63440.1 diguanylate cyclase [Campylobacter hepaticus]MBM0636939.1 diguanylate cyclase [Campylobacter bilis]MCC8277651.1 diguanylate cyclase [Campylobacter bilis]MCC8299260.1 diguanylate cyclase [Campylobacter bilis]MCC8300560.1 diguanylate cyclase [Campylobacter bilis]
MNKKILIIDDNEMLGKLLAKKIQMSLNYEVDIAFNFAKAKQLLENDYFLVFADLCLLDAPNGEVVDYVIKKQIPVIVLTASGDKATKEKFMDKDILDYIFKESQTCVDDILNAIIKLDRYAKTKVILAMSNLSERNEIKKLLLQRQFHVLAAAHGEEAMSYLNDNNDVKLIIADANMPVINGFELLNQVRERFGDDELGVIILAQHKDDFEVDCFKKGVNEYLLKPLSKAGFNCRLDRCLSCMEDKKILNTYNTLDPVCRIKNHNALMQGIEDYFSEIDPKEEFAFAFLDIDNLESINDEYGYQVGDEVIKICANEIVNEIKGRDLVGRYSAQKICILLKNISQEKAIKIFSRIRVNIKKAGVLVNVDEIFFTVCIGVVFAKSGDKLDNLVAKASKILSQAKNNGKDRVEICS